MMFSRICLILFCFPLTLPGQRLHFRPQPALPEPNVREISLIYQTLDHRIWIGTNHGLFYFDGRTYQFKPRPDNTHVRPTSIAEDDEGQLWIGYEDGYIQRLSGQNENTALPADTLKGFAVTSIMFDAQNEAWITTYGQGLWVWDHQEWKQPMLPAGMESLTDVYDALKDPLGRLWLATDDGVWVWSGKPADTPWVINKQQGLPEEIVTSLAWSGDSSIWAGLYDFGLAQITFDQHTFSVYSDVMPASGNLVSIALGPGKEMWAAQEREIIRFTPEGKSRTLKLPEEIKDRINTLFVDREGNVWIAAGNRLFIAHPVLEFITPGLSGIQAVAQTEDALWLGCDSGLFRLDLEEHSTTPFLRGQSINVISLYADADGRLWIGTFGQGLYCLDPKTNQYRKWTEQDSIANNSILNIDGDDRRIYLATLGGISMLSYEDDPLKDVVSVSSFLERFGFPPGYVYDVFVGADQRVWFGTDGKGLYLKDGDRFSPYGLPLQHEHEPQDQINTIYSITSGSDQNLWVAGEDGNVICIGSSGALISAWRNPEGHINSLVAAGNGDVLMIYEDGIKRIDTTGPIPVFEQNSGLISFSPNINAVCTAPDGTVWIGEDKTLIHYIPPPEDMGQQVQMQIERMIPAALDSPAEIRLQPDSNFIDIRFSGLWYRDPARVRYRYKLEGHDQDWIYTSEGRAVYSRLSPGTYTFKVEGSTRDDFKGAGSLSKTFVVVPPVYQRWWFVLLIITLGALAIYAYVLSRIKRIKMRHEHEREKTMLRLHAIQAQVNPHFLFNSFNTLAGIIEENQSAAVDYVDQLSAFFRDVLMHRNAELIQLEEELGMVRHYGFILEKRYGHNLRIHEDIRQVKGWIAPLSIQLLVENAIKHNVVSAEKPLDITITTDHEWVTVSNPVQPKIAGTAESTGFGLSSLVSRYQYLTREKVMILEDQETFTVKIPVIHKDESYEDPYRRG